MNTHVRREALSKNTVSSRRRGSAKIRAIMLLALVLSTPLLGSAQTTNPDLNDLLGEVEKQKEWFQGFKTDLTQKDRQLRTACWQGNQRACQALDDLLVNPNLGPSGIPIEPPAGAYWPFDPNGVPRQPRGRR